MLRFSRPSLSILASACVAVLSGCGGGSSSDTPATGGATALSGTVAVGAPMVNATVTVKDAHGVTRTAAVDSEGHYSGLSLDGLTAPFEVQACGLVGGDSQCFYSVVNAAGVANVTPLTHATLSLALGQDASTMFAHDTAPPSAAQLAAKEAALKAALAPLFAQIGGGLSGQTDFTSTAFTADRTGMDKLLDAVKISVGTDVDGSNNPTSFVQLEGKIGSGSTYLGHDGSSSGSLSGGAGLSVDLRGISNAFVALSRAVGSATVGACTTAMAGSNVFDAAFSLKMDGTLLDASSIGPGLCQAASDGGLLGGRFANPVVNHCDFSGADKICVVGFDIVKGDTVFDGAELAVVLRNGSTAWKLLGRESVYEIHVNANVQRTIRVGVANPTPQYTRAFSFDIGTNSGAVQSAKVYQHNSSGTGWDATPIATLDANGCSSSPRLTMSGSACGSTWLSVDSYSNGSLADGDALIDAFYKRGREVKIELYAQTYANIGSNAPVATVVKRIEGVPPKSAALASMPWLELDATTKANLAAYAGASANFTATWLANKAVSAKDISFCLSGDCSSPAAHTEVSGSHNGASQTLTLSATPSAATDYKQISLYGRDRDQMGVATNYVSCQTSSMNCPAP